MSIVAPERTEESRREFVQRSAKQNYRRRVGFSYVFMGTLALAVVIAFIPLISILYNVISHGWHYMTWSFFTTPQKATPSIFHQNDIGGVSNAITGTLLIDACALAMAVPFAMVLSVALYESNGRAMHYLRQYVEIMVGLPSILFGIFVYNFIVTPMGYQLTALAGMISLAILMVPLMTVACEAALRSVPPTLVEAALSLGARKSRVMMRVVLPYALPRMLTGIILSLSRAVGETAPILFVIGTSLLTNWNPLSQSTTLPTAIYNDLQSQYSSLREATWGMALILITTVFALNLASRLIVARTEKRRK